MQFTIGQVTLKFSEDGFKVTFPLDKYEIGLKISHLPQTERPLEVQLSVWQLYEGNTDASKTPQ